MSARGAGLGAGQKPAGGALNAARKLQCQELLGGVGRRDAEIAEQLILGERAGAELFQNGRSKTQGVWR